jgi:hypothetical protein
LKFDLALNGSGEEHSTEAQQEVQVLDVDNIQDLSDAIFNDKETLLGGLVCYETVQLGGFTGPHMAGQENLFVSPTSQQVGLQLASVLSGRST